MSVCLILLVYQPDRPVPAIIPGSSSGPAFVVQVIRPRLGLPLGGLVPPQLLGLDADLGFDSESDGAEVLRVAPGLIRLSARDWELKLVFDDNGGIMSDTEVVFDLVFEDNVRRVRCHPANPAIGSLILVATGQSGEISGHFDIELPDCVDAETGASLNWPSTALILHGSFDRLPQEHGSK